MTRERGREVEELVDQDQSRLPAHLIKRVRERNEAV
jgi:hypothetical protein